MNYYLDVLKKYAVFSGRARRAEYWFFALFNLIVSLILSAVDTAVGLEIGLSLVYSLAVILPSLAVTVRRLHDTGRSGWWLLAMLGGHVIMLLGVALDMKAVILAGVVIAAVVAIIVVVFMFLSGTAGENKYGPNPVPADA